MRRWRDLYAFLSYSTNRFLGSKDRSPLVGSPEGANGAPSGASAMRPGASPPISADTADRTIPVLYPLTVLYCLYPLYARGRAPRRASHAHGAISGAYGEQYSMRTFCTIMRCHIGSYSHNEPAAVVVEDAQPHVFSSTHSMRMQPSHRGADRAALRPSAPPSFSDEAHIRSYVLTMTGRELIIRIHLGHQEHAADGPPHRPYWSPCPSCVAPSRSPLSPVGVHCWAGEVSVAACRREKSRHNHHPAILRT